MIFLAAQQIDAVDRIPIDGIGHQPDQDDDKPPGFVYRWHNADLQCADLVGPAAIRVGTFYFQLIISVLNVGKAGKTSVGVYFCPVVVKSLQALGVAYFIALIIIERRKLDTKHLVRFMQLNPGQFQSFEFEKIFGVFDFRWVNIVVQYFDSGDGGRVFE
jgi:hypothetical protein